MTDDKNESAKAPIEFLYTHLQLREGAAHFESANSTHYECGECGAAVPHGMTCGHGLHG